MELEKQKQVLVRGGYWLLVGGLAYLGIRYLLPLLLPFVWGLLIAWMLRPPAGFLRRHSGLGPKGSALMAAFLFYLLAGALLWLAGSWIAAWGEDFFRQLPALYTQRIAPFLEEVSGRVGLLARRFSGSEGEAPGAVTQAFSGAVEEAVTSASAWGMEAMGRLVTAIPGSFLAVLFTIMSSVLFCAEFDTVTGFLLRQVPVKYHETAKDVKVFFTATLGKMLRAYLLLTLITFVLLAVGLWLLGVPGFWAVAGLIAVVDLLPVVGSGVVLVPWGIYALMGGETLTGGGLILLWIVICGVRQVLEPRIVGRQIGLHPLLSIIAMYIGLRTAGFFGLLVAPMACLLLVHLQQKGILRLVK